ncbi:hypothetical protein FZC76_11950 [Sutcliffiella horikoshii]|uniref:YpoC-like domain-containing protein n=1 Tax=Sutcliffiella horikoshii TaxID=79883 RepID=A0A5D4SYR9_9BACI|nr:hypothetical protein [Sutcliffiella horikoshii]TYS68435.1 hypothetical protein FZC76_11950 [Sutcliffiella horikoshii]
MKIPESFLHPHFYSNQDSISIKIFSLADIIEVPFKFDIAYYLGVAPDQLPWEMTSDSIPHILTSWKEKEILLNSLHEVRDRKEARKQIVLPIAWFLQLLFWMNGQPVRGLTDWKIEVCRLKWKPINVDERLEFVIKKPEMYHSFIQLQQLYTECAKLFYKIKVLEKK